MIDIKREITQWQAGFCQEFCCTTEEHDAEDATLKHVLSEITRLSDEILRLRAAMAKAAQRAEEWPDSGDDPAEVLADCVNILYAGLKLQTGQ